MSNPAPLAEHSTPGATVRTPRSFRYEAQSADGGRVTGVVDADDATAAAQRIGHLQLRLIRLDPVTPTSDAAREPRGGRALRGEEFIAFNQQLAHLAKAGLPIESGLRLIAKDLRRGKLAQTVQLVADELDRGTPIGQAFDKYRDRFPSLYGRLLEAGVRSGNLPGVLLNFGAHLEMLQRLRSALWRTLSYPLTVLAALAVVLVFLNYSVLPQFRSLFAGLSRTPVFNYKTWSQTTLLSGLPLPTQILFVVAQAAPWVAGAVLAAFLLGPVVWQFLRLRGLDRNAMDTVALHLPLVGRVLRLDLVARWCDALRIGVGAGLPLPEAIGLAGDAVRSPRLRRDGQILTMRLEKGLPLNTSRPVPNQAPNDPSWDLSLLPETVPVAMELASGHNDLPATLGSLADLYERQAEQRVNAIPAVLTPLMVIVVAVSIGFVILALLLPLAKMMDYFVR